MKHTQSHPTQTASQFQELEGQRIPHGDESPGSGPVNGSELKSKGVWKPTFKEFINSERWKSKIGSGS